MTQGTLPVLPVADVDAIVDSYVKRLGFTEDFRFPGEDGVTANAQVRRGNCQIMFNRNPKDADRGGGGIWLWLRADDVDIDQFYAAVREAGFTVREEIGDRFWGDRSFAVDDGFGYTLAFNKKIAG